MLVYNDSLSQVFSSTGAITIGYNWWVAEGTTLLPCIYGTPFLFNPVINTDGQMGTFYLDYSIGDNGENLIYDRSDDHIITVGMPDNVTVTNAHDSGSGSLREAIGMVDFYGTVNFDLNANDTIFLQEELLVYKDVYITGDEQTPVILSGNKENRVFFIQAGRHPQLSNLHIVHGKSVGYGGGIFCDSYSNPFLSNLTIRDNVAEKGGGVYCAYNASATFDSLHKSDIYLNKALWGTDICGYQGSFLEVFADTFTVQHPSEYHIWPLDISVYHIDHGKLDQIDADVYISPEGDDSNSGLSSEESFLTIDHAFLVLRADSMHHHSIYLSNGTYSPSLNDQVFPVIVPDYIDIIGESESGTILDAEGQSTVIEVDRNSSTKLTGLTLTGGTTGIWCYTASMELDNINISDNSGSGIRDRASICNLENVTISNNNTEDRGGGIYSLDSYYSLKKVHISNNTSGYTGGGIYFEDVNVVLENVTISNNTGVYGGGISCHRSTFSFDNTNRCNIYNNAAIYGNDLNLYSYANVILDTFTVLYPTEFHALGDIDFDIMNGKFEQADADLFVSPGGNDDNTGLSADDPLKSIRSAMSRIRADSAAHHTIQLLEGTYGPTSNTENLPIIVRSYFSISGTSANEVILDAEGLSGVMKIECSSGTKISDLTITGGDAEYGAGIYCYGNPTIENVIIRNNIAVDGAAMRVAGTGALLQNVLIAENTAQYCGGIACASTELMVQNITITNNSGARAGGLYLSNGSSVIMRNSIISGNTGVAVHFMSFNSENYMTASWSNINGWVATNGNGNYSSIGNSLSEDPLFEGTGDHPYSLAQGSPCIDAGYPSSSLYHLPEWDILGNLRFWDGDGDGDTIVDMGAYEYGAFPVGEEELWVAGCMLQVELYPNPASGVSKLRYKMQDAGYRMIEIYTISGRKIRELINQEMPAGEHEIEIDVSDLRGGVYFVRVQVGKESSVAKLLVVH